MKSTLLDISAKLDSEVVYAFSCISEAAAKQAVDFLVVGATARDYLLELDGRPKYRRLSGDAADLVLEPAAPLEEIGVQMLGRDMAAICNRGAGEMLAEILRREQSDADTNPLAAALTSAAGPPTALDEMLHLLRLLKRGFDAALMRLEP